MNESYLIDRCSKMSFLLGIAMGALSEVIRDTTLANFQKQHVQEALSTLTDEIDKLFYGKADE